MSVNLKPEDERDLMFYQNQLLKDAILKIEQITWHLQCSGVALRSDA